MLPFSFRHAFSLFDFQPIFLIFLSFLKHEQTSWFQTMEFIESIRAKVIWTLVGGPTFLISSLILILKMIVWYLIDFDSSWRYAWICFIFVIGLTLLPIKALQLAIQVRSFSSFFREFYGHVCYWWLYPCMMWFLGV